MPYSDEGLIETCLILLAGCIAGLIILHFIKKAIDKSRYRKYKEKIISLLDKHGGQACLYCKYIEGIENTMQNSICYLIATQENLLILFMSDPEMKVFLDYEKISSFKHVTAKHSDNFFNTRVHDSIENETLIDLIYVTYNKSDTESSALVFSYDIVKEHKIKIYLDEKTAYFREDQLFNTESLAYNNIFDYVNSHISQQDRTLIL